MRIPLKGLLKRQVQVRLAELQDEVVDIVYRVCPKAVLHGGTAIWRCFQGSRFSEDLDFYAIVVKDFKQDLEEELRKRSLSLVKFRQTSNAVFAKVSNGLIECSLELSNRKSPESLAASFEKADASSIEVFTLSAEGLLLEKASAFSNRRLVRDLYDVFFLLSKVEDFSKVKLSLYKLVTGFKAPVDEKNLKALVFSGIAPSSQQMIEKIKRFSKMI